MPNAYSFGVPFHLLKENRNGEKPKIKLTAA